MTLQESQAHALSSALGMVLKPPAQPAEQDKRQPGILDDPVWWLEHAIDEIKYERFEDGYHVVKILEKLRNDAWDCQTGRIDAMYKDAVADSDRYREVYGDE